MNEFTLVSWLKSIGYSSYYQHFKIRGYDTLRKCSNIHDQDLDAMGIQQMAARKAILAASNRLTKVSHGTGDPPMALADSDDDVIGSGSPQKQYRDKPDTDYPNYFKLEKEEYTQLKPIRGRNVFPPSHSRNTPNPSLISPHPSPDSASRFRATSFTSAVETDLSRHNNQQSHTYIPLHLQNGSSRRLKKIPPVELKMILHDKLVEDGVNLTREPYNNIEVGIKIG